MSVSSKRFQRKLKALQFAYWSKFDINDYNNIQTLVIFLEQQCIRELKVAERTGLKNIKSNKWMDSFASYLDTLECPFECQYTDKQKKTLSQENWILIIEWLLSQAIMREYSDKKSQYNAVKPIRRIKKKTYGLKNCLTKECSKELEILCKFLNIPFFDNTKVLCNTLFNFIKQKFDALTLYNFEEYNKDYELIKNKKNSIIDDRYKQIQNYKDINEFFQDYNDFNTGNEKIDAAIVVLRMLYIYDLKQEQAQLNEIINFIQKFTANPKTNSKLGKVGY